MAATRQTRPSTQRQEAISFRVRFFLKYITNCSKLKQLIHHDHRRVWQANCLGKFEKARLFPSFKIGESPPIKAMAHKTLEKINCIASLHLLEGGTLAARSRSNAMCPTSI